MLERANLLLEGYFRVLYVPLGGSKTRMENIISKSMKFYIFMFSDKPLCFGIVERHCNHTARGNRGFFFFHIFFLSLCSRGFFYIFFLSLFFDFFLFLSLLFPLPFLGSVFSSDGLCNCLRLSFQPEWIM